MDHSIAGMIKSSDLEASGFPRIKVNPDPRLVKRIEAIERRLADLESEQLMRRASHQPEAISANEALCRVSEEVERGQLWKDLSSD